MIKGPHFYVYADAAGEWRWHFRASNGNIIADSGEGYIDKADCLHGIDLMKREGPEGSVLKG